MKNYTYHILATLLFFIGVASIKAQTLEIQNVVKASGNYDVVKYDDKYHVVQGTQVTVTLKGTPPGNTQYKQYNSNVTYYKGITGQLTPLSGNTDTFEPTSGQVNYTAEFTYQEYAPNAETGEPEPVGNPQKEYKTASVTFVVYNDPKIDNISLTPQNKKTYQGAGDIPFTVGNLSNPNGLRIVVDWQEDNNQISNDNHTTTYNFTPSTSISVGNHTIKAKVKVLPPNDDGEHPWWTSKQYTSNVTVLRNPSEVVQSSNLANAISPFARKYSYPGQSVNNQDVQYEFNVDLSKIQGTGNYKWKYIWEFNNDKRDPSANSNVTFANPSVPDSYIVKLSVQAYNPDSETMADDDKWGNPISCAANEVVTVLQAPSISLNSLAPDYNGLTYVAGHNVTVTLNCTTNAASVNGYTEKIEWKEGANGTYTVNSSGESNKYAFNPTGKQATEYPIYARVSIIGPDNTVWGSKETDGNNNPQPVTIKVLPNPTSVVTSNQLKISETSNRKFSHVNQKIDGNPLTYQYSVNLSTITGHDNYKWEYTWSLIKLNESGAQDGNPISLTDDVNNPYNSKVTVQNPSGAAKYKVHLKVQAHDPNAQELNENNKWGNAIEADGDIFTVLPNPAVVVTQEAIQQNISRTTPQYSYVGKKNTSHEYKIQALDNRYHWEYSWTLSKFDDEGNQEGDTIATTAVSSDSLKATFANPSTKGTYKAILQVRACNPENKYEKWSEWISGTANDNQSLVVFNNPNVAGIRFVDSEIDMNVTQTNSITTVEVVRGNDVDNAITISPNVTWSAIFGKITNNNDGTGTYTAPSYSTEKEAITARMKFYVGEQLLKDTTETKAITVQAVALKPNKSVTFVDDSDFNLTIDGYDDVVAYLKKNYTEANGFYFTVEWSTNVSGNGKTATLNLTNDSIQGDSKDIDIIARICIRNDKTNFNWTWTEVKTKVQVYKTPTISSAQIAPDSELSCVEHNRTLTTTVDFTPTSLPLRVEWYKNDEEDPFATKTETVTNNEEGKFTLKCEYTPVEDDVDNSPSFYAKVYVCNPDANNDAYEKWTNVDDVSTTASTIITVYEKPDVAVSAEILQNKVTENVGANAGQPEMLVGYEGQEGLKFDYEVSNLDSRYHWTYTWELLNENKETIEDKEPQVTQNPSFSNLTEGTYYVKLTAKAYNKKDYPEGDKVGEFWGQQEVTLVDSITIYSAPQYSPVDYHKVSTEDTEENRYTYSIIKGEPFDASKLFSYETEGKVTGYPDGWIKKLTVTKGGNTIQEESSNLTFIPDETGEYELTLNVTNTAPTGEWYNNIVSNNNNPVIYTLHVYNNPILNNNLAGDNGLFDEPDNDSGKLVRHVKSQDPILFTINVEDGDPNADWTITMTSTELNDGNPVDFVQDNNNLSQFTYNFNETISSDKEEDIYDFHIHGTNNISCLYKESNPSTLDVQGTIHVWKEITAKVDGLTLDNEGNYVLETRVGDSDRQEIKITLVGGDSDPNNSKWSINDPNKSVGAPDGTTLTPKWDKDRRVYTYSIQDSSFTEAGDYTYTFYPKYKDGATSVNNTIPFIIKVYPEPTLSQTLALANPSNNPHKNVSYTPDDESVKYTLTCYEDDNLQMSVTPDGGKTDEVWMYQIGSGTKQTIPNDGIINVASTGTITFYNYLGSKEKEVKTVVAEISRKSSPNTEMILPTVDNTNYDIWKSSTAESPISLYGDGSQIAQFDFSPMSGSEGNENGWSYSWKVNDVEQSNNYGTWNYQAALNNPNSAYENQTISVIIKNSIPGGTGQTGENVGYFDDSRKYYVRVWHAAVLPTGGYTLTDKNNAGNDVKTTHSIREGNTLTAHIDPITFGYNPGGSGSYYEYAWEGLGAKNQNEWSIEMENTEDSNTKGFSDVTYNLIVRSKGPRNVWAENTSYTPCNVIIYNRPKTPTSIFQKGNGASGTMVITAEVTDKDLEGREYYLVFGYTDANKKDHDFASRKQENPGLVRWSSQYLSNISDASQREYAMQNAYVYAVWKYANGPEITSGKCIRKGESSYVDDTYDSSTYNGTTRAAIGKCDVDIDIDDPETINGSDEVRYVYTLNGSRVGSSLSGLKHGLYIVEYKNGVTRKISVK